MKLPELIDRFNSRLASAADTPVTVLMGISPGGLNATGESDITLFDDRIEDEQTLEFQPAIEKVARLQMAARGMAPEEWSIHFNPLHQKRDKEKAEERKLVAETDQIYFNMGGVAARKILEERFGGEEYSMELHLTQEDLDEAEALMEEEKEKEFEQLKQLKTGGQLGPGEEEEEEETLQ